MEPQAPGALAAAKAPAWLTAAQRQLWQDVVARAPYGVLRQADSELVTAFVVHCDVFRQATEAQAGRPLVDATGKPSPYLRLLRQHSAEMVGLGAQLGLSPMARARLGQPTDEVEEPAHEFELFDVILPGGKRIPHSGAPGKSSLRSGSLRKAKVSR